MATTKPKITIVKHGKFYNQKFKGKCPECGCEFITKFNTKICFDFPPSDDPEFGENEEYITTLCPECDMRTRLSLIIKFPIKRIK